MRLAFIYGPWCLGRPFDFDALYTAPRGLTGSELSCVEYARAMRARGHEVSLLVAQNGLEPRDWNGIRVERLASTSQVAGCDAVLAWNEPDHFRNVPEGGPLRILNQQLNDFSYCIPGWEQHTDVVTSPSAHHLEFLKRQAPGVRAWDVLPNGCDPTQYRAAERLPGRVIWASSADRGLHRLLEAWPLVRRAVPHASLRAFYNFNAAPHEDYEATGPLVHPDLLEVAQRTRYVRAAMEKYQRLGWDVKHEGSVSRERLRDEFERSVVLGYPCDTIRYTEGFSVTTLEACAAGVLPVITDVDALGSIYGAAAPAFPFPPGGFDAASIAAYADLVVRGLTDDAWRAEHVAKCRALAATYAWPVLAARLEALVAQHRPSSASHPLLSVEAAQ